MMYVCTEQYVKSVRFANRHACHFSRRDFHTASTAGSLFMQTPVYVTLVI